MQTCSLGNTRQMSLGRCGRCSWMHWLEICKEGLNDVINLANYLKSHLQVFPTIHPNRAYL